MTLLALLTLARGDPPPAPLPPVYTDTLVVTHRELPQFPEAARAAGIEEATCRLDVTTDEAGVPYLAEPLGDCPDAFQAESVRAALLWRWRPVVLDGQPPRPRFRLAFHYTVPPPDPPAPPPQAPDESSHVVNVYWAEVQLRHRVVPEFPAVARRKGIRDSSCVVHVIIDERGIPVAVETKACDALFLESAVTATLKWRWEPLLREGRPVRAGFDLAFHYTLK